jgi:hypothetical protein
VLFSDICAHNFSRQSRPVDRHCNLWLAFANSVVLDLARFQNWPLRGGFTIAEVRLTAEFLFDPLRRPATAQTIIRGNRFHILLRSDLDEFEFSVSLYHEALEAATVAAECPPDSVIEFNEGDFEQAAQESHARFGVVSPEALNQMLVEFGF